MGSTKKRFGIFLILAAITMFVIAFCIERFFASVILFFAAVIFFYFGSDAVRAGNKEQDEAAEADKERVQRSIQRQEARQLEEKAAEARKNIIAKKSKILSEIPRESLSIEKASVPRKRLCDIPELKTINSTDPAVFKDLFPIVVIDTETTGLSPSSERIIEFAAIKYDADFSPISCMTTFVNPDKPIPEKATKINHITDDMVKDSPKFKNIARQISDYLRGCTIVGHNVMFDVRFIFASGVDIEPGNVIDTLELARRNLWSVSDYKLGTLCAHYNIVAPSEHRALSDCYATAELLKNLYNKS